MCNRHCTEQQKTSPTAEKQLNLKMLFRIGLMVLPEHLCEFEDIISDFAYEFDYRCSHFQQYMGEEAILARPKPAVLLFQVYSYL